MHSAFSAHCSFEGHEDGTNNGRRGEKMARGLGRAREATTTGREGEGREE